MNENRKAVALKSIGLAASVTGMFCLMAALYLVAASALVRENNDLRLKNAELKLRLLERSINSALTNEEQR
jgi:regulator of replication initiation timing